MGTRFKALIKYVEKTRLDHIVKIIHDKTLQKQKHTNFHSIINKKPNREYLTKQVLAPKRGLLILAD